MPPAPAMRQYGKLGAMNEAGKTVVFVSLAMNQTLFYEQLGRELERLGYRVAVICFHERSHRYLSGLGVRSFNAFEHMPTNDVATDWGRLGVANPAFWTSHEAAAFEIRDGAALLRKFSRYVGAVETIFDALQGDGKQVVVVQELGGFTSILAVYFVALARDIDNWFIEPSFFRGRVFLTRNSIKAPIVNGPSGHPAGQDVQRYLELTLAARAVVIPEKDKGHYRRAASKIFDRRNWQRLCEKLADKYLLGMREEFGHIRGHAWRHLRMAANSRELRRFYRGLPETGDLIYYPLHVPADVALTLRSPEWLDQFALIDYLCRCAPAGSRVVVKEHPALVGAISPRRVRELLARHDNFVLLDARMNNYEVLARSSLVVTVNSKAGAEAILLGKPVMVLGDAFYRSCELVKALERSGDLATELAEALRSRTEPVRAGIEGYFQDVWSASRPGELYDLSESNVKIFGQSMDTLLQGGSGNEVVAG
jgi:hypothetical protein